MTSRKREFLVSVQMPFRATDSADAVRQMREYMAENLSKVRYRAELPMPSGPDEDGTPKVRELARHLLELETEEEVMLALAEARVQIIGRPPEMSREERDGFRRSWGFTTDEEVDEALALSGLVMITMGDVSAAARTAKYPLTVAKAIVGAGGGLDSELRNVVPILRERGFSWSQIGTALGTSKQSAWERFSGED